MGLMWAVLLLVIIGAAAALVMETWIVYVIIWLIIVIFFVKLFGKAGSGAKKAGSVMGDALKKEKEDVENIKPKPPSYGQISELTKELGKKTAQETMTTFEERDKVPPRKIGENIQSASSKFLEELFRLLGKKK